jgi:hypothetical protein
MHVCDCDNFSLPDCCQLDLCDFICGTKFETSIRDTFAVARNHATDELGIENNVARKGLYSLGYFALDFGGCSHGERRKLPNCYCAIVRQLYPSADGNYMGFRES